MKAEHEKNGTERLRGSSGRQYRPTRFLVVRDRFTPIRSFQNSGIGNIESLLRYGRLPPNKKCLLVFIPASSGAALNH